MRLKPIFIGQWQILSPVVKDGDVCSVEVFMDQVGTNYQSSFEGLLALMRRHSLHGPQSFNSEQCHPADPNAEFYEYRKGDLRLFWFSDKGRIVICTYGIIKKGQKVKERDLRQSREMKRRYMEAKAAAQIIIIDEE